MKLDTLTNINKEVYDLGGSIKILGRISWPRSFELDFLSCYKKGKVWLPQISYDRQIDWGVEDRLLKLRDSFTANDPLEVLTRKTIQSFLDSIQLTSRIGSPGFTALSKDIFGVPDDQIPGSKLTNIDVAKKILELSNEFSFHLNEDKSNCINAENIKDYLERRIQGVFSEQGPEVIIVPDLAAKATATGKRIKLREGNDFSPYDFKQLFYHEVMTHSLTSINGELQPILKCLGRSSLRTLKTQEGLATFSEVITGGMDIHRLKRIALRIIAIDMALNGANFVELFEFFRNSGQSESESFNATQRVFRGGFPDKNIVFTKDSIYLQGLINIHTFFRWAMKHNRLELCHLLFSGKLSLSDVFDLEDAYRYQWIAPPKYLPAWFSKTEGLAGTLGFSLIANLVRIDVAERSLKWAS